MVNGYRMKKKYSPREFEKFVNGCPDWEKDYQTATHTTIKRMIKDSKMLQDFSSILESFGETTNKEYLKDLTVWMNKLDDILSTLNHLTSEPTHYNQHLSPNHPSFME
tara:strand:- start:739 stop:1062 length:324 start_codon:yes stop_codon:yes gene_type:complete